MNILDEIVANTRAKVSIAKEKVSLDDMILTIHSTKIVKSKFKASLKDKDQAIIAEIKKASPSAGVISEDFDPVTKAREYKAFGASALSILTEEDYFLGGIQFLKDVKEVSDLPILRKDFMLEPYQVHESRALGADCILLIMAALSKNKSMELEGIANYYGMDVLIEVHNEEELEQALELSSPLIGINNRNRFDSLSYN